MTPMMQQWHACKKAQPDAILLFRLGDFYEAFHDDAKILSDELELTLTQRQGIPMSGIPYHAAEGYIEKMVAKGHLIAIAEQVGNPKTSKGLVKREVARTISPGTTLSETLIPSKQPCYFVALAQVNKTLGLACLDHTTGQLTISEFNRDDQLLDELFRIGPKECLTYAKVVENRQELFDELNTQFKTRITLQESYHFDHQSSYDLLTEHLKTQTLDGFGVMGMSAAINSAGALLAYIRDRRNLPIDHIVQIRATTAKDFVAIDKATQRGLELIEPLMHSHRHHTLLHHLDRTSTPMGARLMRDWVSHPLISVEMIQMRQDASYELGEVDLLNGIRDIERLMTRIGSGYGTPRDLLALRYSLEAVPAIQTLLDQLTSPLFKTLQLVDLGKITTLIQRAISDTPPLRLSDGGTIRPGYNAELDELQNLKNNARQWLADYQVRLREELGIKTLKVTFNKAFGYSIEVSRAQSSQMPETFHKRQTLVNAERFISEELKTFEEKILGAEEKIATLEAALFAEIRAHILDRRADILQTARAIAHFDCIHALAKLTKQTGYTRPTVDDSDTIHIECGRHPVIENALPGHTFIPNDTHLDTKDRLFIITGPNMAGKSTYIRQVAIITIMAQIGAPVPADHAHIGVVDKVFSRIGASDDLARGQSTFMVEMLETANILNNATDKSLVILDEIGRGTSTYDGVAIAWAVAEYLLTAIGHRAKTLFATHYFELTELEHEIPGAINYTVAVHEAEDRITFLRKIKRGDTDKSYGIHVARLAGLPSQALTKARQMLTKLQQTPTKKPEQQLTLFTPPHPVIESLKSIDVNHLTPLEALQTLIDLQKKCSI